MTSLYSLFDDGVSSTSIEALNKEIDELIRIAKWYQTQKKSTHPSEAETISLFGGSVIEVSLWMDTAKKWQLNGIMWTLPCSINFLEKMTI